MNDARYADPQALRQALADRLRRITRERPTAQLQDLQRQVAYDRLLCRIFMHDAEGWVLKGATAMLARLRGAGRHTLDIDLFRPSNDLAEAEAALRTAAAYDVGDWFRFTVSPGRSIEAQGAPALRAPVVAYLGATRYAEFPVDLVVDVAMTGAPETVEPLLPVDIPGLVRVPYRAYPLVDHIADKLCALIETHPRADGTLEGSTRYRDLADIVVFAHTSEPDAASLDAAIRSEVGRRGLALPAQLVVSGAAGWRAGYARVARDVPGLAERDLAAATATASSFLDPVLAGRARGRWSRSRLAWG